ncbi:hypothetical protein CDV36_007514 [Fusarium kuroshium]|uniref:Uncharacterized protein n=1 Tax=Fusarium kuroshium TaxID=2010991 RepID=A0A3M2S5R6_9HYPO|nr:hypothetical protein CDV36_007514 [Fusarium kuroshium]
MADSCRAGQDRAASTPSHTRRNQTRRQGGEHQTGRSAGDIRPLAVDSRTPLSCAQKSKSPRDFRGGGVEEAGGEGFFSEQEE